jgi:hypothetical protein
MIWEKNIVTHFKTLYYYLLGKSKAIPVTDRGGR